jgi:hypothetical protein
VGKEVVVADPTEESRNFQFELATGVVLFKLGIRSERQSGLDYWEKHCTSSEGSSNNN